MTNYLNVKNGIEILHTDGLTQILAGALNPYTEGLDASVGSIYLCSSTSGTIYKKSGVGSHDWTPDWDFQLIKTYIGLLDTPTTYSGSVGKYPRVNEAGTGLEFQYLYIDNSDPDVPLISETSISGTYLVNYEAGRLLLGSVGNRPDLVFNGPIAALSFADNKTESCYGSFKIPYSWNTESDIKVTVNFMNDYTQTGIKTCSWRLAYQSYHEGDTFSSKTTTVVDINYTFPEDGQAGTFWIHTLYMNTDDTNNPLGRGDILTFQFYREGLAPLDNMVGECILLTLMFELQTGQHVIGDT